MSNSSRDSNTSPPIVNHNIVNSTPKRSGAKANRYQSFYDQSFKLSNALKSSESVNLTKPNSPKHVNMTLYMSSNNSSTLHTPPHQPQSQPQGLSQAFGQPKFYKESSRLLAHSSSLPVLQSQRGMPKYQRHGELRTRYIEINKLSPPPSIQSATSGSPTSSPSKGTLPKFIQKDNRIEISVTSPQQQTTSNSPISIISDTNSTMTSNISTVQSTDHSSFVSDSKEREKERALQTPPMIVVSNEKDSNDIETVRNSPVFMSSGSKPSSPTKRTPRRPLTPNEQKVIQETRIPPFKANMHQKSAKKPSEFKVPAPKRINDHSKSKSLSMVLTDLAPKLSKSTSTLGDDSSIKSNKSSKLISWFRRK
ncbi:hypothetical protein CANTEDRAFT_121753 [Yamadazyma tenuis ATCC 10573]|nr:uncharacterized protein CANTEDRAFT_121753 [Yamadazyma tenuis ATCC 10573]EGV63911.1 hypothetical protein CANTEDRAFT_121753 [Yamadazyma tenuis ATCC 10573]